MGYWESAGHLNGLRLSSGSLGQLFRCRRKAWGAVEAWELSIAGIDLMKWHTLGNLWHAVMISVKQGRRTAEHERSDTSLQLLVW